MLATSKGSNELKRGLISGVVGECVGIATTVILDAVLKGGKSRAASPEETAHNHAPGFRDGDRQWQQYSEVRNDMELPTDTGLLAKDPNEMTIEQSNMLRGEASRWDEADPSQTPTPVTPTQAVSEEEIEVVNSLRDASNRERVNNDFPFGTWEAADNMKNDEHRPDSVTRDRPRHRTTNPPYQSKFALYTGWLFGITSDMLLGDYGITGGLASGSIAAVIDVCM